MSEALTPPFIVAALLLSVAGALKLRSPQGTGEALRALVLPVGAWTVPALAAGEVALGAACAIDPTRASAAVLAGAYAAFVGVAAALARRGSACGCFGADDTPVSAIHWIASAGLGAVALGATVAGPQGLGWVLGRPAPQVTALLIGIVGAVYAAVILYTAVPRAWTAWSGE